MFTQVINYVNFIVSYKRKEIFKQGDSSKQPDKERAPL